MSLVEGIDSLINRVEQYQLETADLMCAIPETTMKQQDAKPMSCDLDAKMDLITRGLGEIMNPKHALQQMRKIMQERPLKIYWGTATTGAPHVAYFIPLTKLGDFLKAGCEVTILLADLHAFLDAEKTPWELLDHRVAYYKAIISAMLRAVNVPIQRLKFVRGSTFQLTKEYTLDVYKLCAKTSVGQGKKAGAEVVKQSDNPALAPVIYPLLQALDEEYLKVDVQFGGIDQRKIFAYASDNLQKVLGYKSRMHLMNPICPSLNAKPAEDGSGELEKMSSSGSKIDPLESSKSVWKKIKKAFCVEGNVDVNGILSFCKFVVFPCFLDGKPFVLKRREQSELIFKSFDELKQAFRDKQVHPLDLKQASFNYLDEVLERVRAEFSSEEMQVLRRNAYPDKKQEVKKENTPQMQWVLDFQQDNGGEMPTVRKIRDGLKLSKREAKRLLDSVGK